jgi:hypothetical protein
MTYTLSVALPHLLRYPVSDVTGMGAVFADGAHNRRRFGGVFGGSVARNL